MTKGLLICSLIIVALIVIIPIIAVVIILKDSKEKDLLKRVIITIFTINIIGLILLISLWITPIKNNELHVQEEEVSETITLETAGFKKLSISEYLELIKSNEKNIILVARPTCGYCEKFSPILKKAADDMNISINYVNTDEFTDVDWTTFSSSLEYLSTEEWGTPLTLIVQNGKLVAANNGYVELEQIKSFFKEHGLGE